MKIVGIEIFQKYHQSCTIALKGTKMIRITRSIDLACLCFCLATRYCYSVFYTVLLQYILEDCIKNEKLVVRHVWYLNWKFRTFIIHIQVEKIGFGTKKNLTFSTFWLLHRMVPPLDWVLKKLLTPKFLKFSKQNPKMASPGPF